MKGQFETFEAYVRAKWGYAKAHAYRLLQTGEFLMAIQSPNGDCGDCQPLTEGQVRPLLGKFPKEHRAACWKEITASAPPASLTGAAVRAGARNFLERRGLLTGPKADAGGGPCAIRHELLRRLGKIRHAISADPDPGRFADAIEGLAKLAAVTPLVPAAGPVVPTGGSRIGRHGAAAAPHRDILPSVGVGTDRKVALPEVEPAAPESPAPGHPAISPDTVAEAMERADGLPGGSGAEADPDSRQPGPPALSGAADAQSAPALAEDTASDSVGPASAEELPAEVSDGAPHRSDAAVADGPFPEGTAKPDAGPVRHFMSCRKLHALIDPSSNYYGWLAGIGNLHKGSLKKSETGGEVLIDLTLARSLADHAPGQAGTRAFHLINEAQHSDDLDPGAVADSLFDRELESAANSAAV